ncbi:MAG: Glu-tRNA(Gln) amidotransferase subunit GatE [Bacteroidetes bacterium]|nr:Glu-tRNA(Gln) amidotransferase subunit GatE [Bacteroidota bacterium]
MTRTFNPVQNYEESKKAIGYVDRKEAKQTDYDRIGFMSGLEVHQQLLTKHKLFCRCPAGLYNQSEDYDAEIVRHMRPTLSELGEYDGTALMEFKTRKNIIYKIKNETACTYEVDDTPPFAVDKEALEKALEISILSKLNIVGEVHITRKQYLDGSIPTGFQRTAILGVEGEIQLRNKKVRLIQLSLEEDSCREISDIGHWRTYKTDRLGMPLIETVTYPDFANPDEVKEGADYIRFLNRSTGKVRTGIGSTRADVNVSCEGGTRVEIKGVAHTNWMPELTHNEAFRQYALLHIRKLLKEKVEDINSWKLTKVELKAEDFKYSYEPLIQAKKNNFKIVAVKLPQFKGLLSHFTQPSKIFADEISDRLKVIACIEKPNMIHSEKIEKVITESNFNKICTLLGISQNDAWIVFWGPEEDIPTAIETIDERCRMAFAGVPNETRKSFANGTTIFERVLPGADRMYPDTDSEPIPLKDEFIDQIRKKLPMDIHERIDQLQSWDVPQDTYTYLLKRNLIPIMEKIHEKLGISHQFIGTFFGHKLKFIENNFLCPQEFSYERLYDLFKYLHDKKLDLSIAKSMLIEYYQHPKMDFDSVLTEINYKPISKDDLADKIPFLKEKFKQIKISEKEEVDSHWVMGQVSKLARGNIRFAELKHLVDSQ